MARRRFLLAYSAAWLAMACIFSVLIQASSPPMPVVVALIAGLNNAVPGALLGLGAWWLATRLAGRGWPIFFFVAVHLVLALAYTFLWTGVVVAALAVMAPDGLADFISSGGIGWQLMGGGLFYIVMAGIAHGRFVTVRNHELAAAAARSEALRIQAELQALRARLDPHFLFNTLHSIMALVRRDAAAGERALERLGDLLRRVLALNRERAEELPLADELDFVRDFLALEALRLGDRLTVIEDIDPDALDCLLPVLTLQPLVENAIRHAIAPRPEGGTVRLSARLEHDDLWVEVEDDGPGLLAVPMEHELAGTAVAGTVSDVVAAMTGGRAGRGPAPPQESKSEDAGRNQAREPEADDAGPAEFVEVGGVGAIRARGRAGLEVNLARGATSESGGDWGGDRLGADACAGRTAPGTHPGAAAGAMGSPDDGPGMGIRLVRERLEARHRSAARLELLAGRAGGVCARITLPARTTPIHASARTR